MSVRSCPVVVYPPSSVWGRPVNPVLHFDPAPLQGVPLSKLRLTKADTLPSAFLDFEGEPVEPPFVYFVSFDGHLKIGFSAFDPRTRLRALQSGCPMELTVEVIMDGDRERERHWHDLFAPMRTRGEWFRLTDEIRKALDLMRSDGLDLGPAAQVVGRAAR